MVYYLDLNWSFNKIPILGALLKKCEMIEIINKLLLAGDIFMPEMHLRQLGFSCIACRPFTKNKERIQ